jgi:hypothetical protein
LRQIRDDIRRRVRSWVVHALYKFAYETKAADCLRFSSHA